MARNKGKKPTAPGRPTSSTEGSQGRTEASGSTEPQKAAGTPAQPTSPGNAAKPPISPGQASPTAGKGPAPGGAAAATRPPAAPTGKTPPPKSGGGFGTGFLGGLIGGAAAAVAIGFGMQQFGGADVEALSKRIDALAGLSTQVEGNRSALDELSGRVSELAQAGDGALADRVEALETRLGELGKQMEQLAAGNAAPAIADLSQRVDTLENDIATLREAAGAGADEERLATLEARLATVESAQQSADQAAQRLSALEEQLGRLATDLETIASTAGQAGADEATATLLANLATRVSAVEAKLPDPAALERVTSDIAELRQRLSTLDEASIRLDELSGTVASLKERLAQGEQRDEALSGQLTALGDQIGALRERIDALAGQMRDLEDQLAASEEQAERTATLALLTVELQTAVQEGAPYEELLGDLEALADDAEVAAAAEALAPFAKDGVPTLTALQKSFPDLAREVVQRARTGDGQGLLDQAAGNLLRLVTVRPVGAEVEGDAPAARVARAEAKLAAGDLAGAVAELEALEGPAAEAAARWLEQARARLAADAALARLQTRTAELLASAA